MARAWIGLGSNEGDRLGYVKKALGMLQRIPKTALVAVSPLYDTAPTGREGQPRFLNLAVELETELTPEALLRELLAIEDRCGRIRRERWGPRTLDLDLLIHGEHETATEGLTLPHPRMAERAFVLVPLAQLAPDLTVPGTGKTVRALLEEIGEEKRGVKRVGDPPAPEEDP
jgi:2-amino-4-hydroxy-6-hydroxymethyldihydropteridine diphosphokinase